MKMTLREVIRKVSADHLKSGNQLYGQCLTAVGWVGGTVPELTEADGLVELSMADVMAGGVITGAALAGTRPIYVVRYQGFQWFNASIIANYAAKSKDVWGIACPIFIRSIAMEGGIGPVAGSSHHGLVNRMPGMKIVSPMTPLEYLDIYKNFMDSDDPMYVSEHRKSYANTEELIDIEINNPDFVLFPFSITRFEADKLARNCDLKISVFHQVWIKPLKISQEAVENLKKSKYGGVVLDDDYPDGIAKQVAYELMLASGKPVRVLTIEEKTAGFDPSKDNLPPSSDKIYSFLLKLI